MCPKCKCEVRVIAFIEQQPVIRKILSRPDHWKTHLVGAKHKRAVSNHDPPVTKHAAYQNFKCSLSGCVSVYQVDFLHMQYVLPTNRLTHKYPKPILSIQKRMFLSFPFILQMSKTYTQHPKKDVLILYPSRRDYTEEEVIR